MPLTIQVFGGTRFYDKVNQLKNLLLLRNFINVLLHFRLLNLSIFCQQYVQSSIQYFRKFVIYTENTIHFYLLSVNKHLEKTYALTYINEGDTGSCMYWSCCISQPISRCKCWRANGPRVSPSVFT